MALQNYKYKLQYSVFLLVSVHFKKNVDNKLDLAFYIALSTATNSKSKMYTISVSLSSPYTE